MKLPSGWKKTNLCEVLSQEPQNGYSPNCVEEQTGRFVLGLGNLTDCGLNIKDLKNIPIDDERVNAFQLMKGDFLISRSNTPEKVGRVGLFTSEALNIFYPDLMMRFRINKKIATNEFFKYMLNSATTQKYYQSCAAGSSATMVKINKDTVKNTPILLPPLSEQKAIAELLSTWDTAIDKTERLIVTKEKKYTFLLANFYSKSKAAKIPIGKFASEVSIRNKNLSISQVLSVTNKNGFVLPEDQFERQVASTNLSNYKIVSSGEYAYNPSRINVGSIARLDNWKEGVLSPMYTVFKLEQKLVDSDFFLHWLNSHEAKTRIKKSAQGSVRETVSFTDFCEICMPMPIKTEQTKIAIALNSVKNELQVTADILEKFKEQKRGLMRKLLTGMWRVNF